MTITFRLIARDTYAFTLDGMRVDTAVLTADGYVLDQGEFFTHLNAATNYITDCVLA